MFRKFKFEQPIYARLQVIPLSTHYKLDRVGVRLDLKTWNRLSNEERQVLCHLPVRSQGEVECYRDYLLFLLKRLKEKADLMDESTVRRERSDWESLTRIPDEVYLRSLELKVLLTPTQWIQMDDLERYSLYRLSVEKHSMDQLALALEEFLGITLRRAGKAAEAS